MSEGFFVKTVLNAPDCTRSNKVVKLLPSNYLRALFGWVKTRLDILPHALTHLHALVQLGHGERTCPV